MVKEIPAETLRSKAFIALNDFYDIVKNTATKDCHRFLSDHCLQIAVTPFYCFRFYHLCIMYFFYGCSSGAVKYFYLNGKNKRQERNDKS